MSEFESVRAAAELDAAMVEVKAAFLELEREAERVGDRKLARSLRRFKVSWDDVADAMTECMKLIALRLAERARDA